MAISRIDEGAPAAIAGTTASKSGKNRISSGGRVFADADIRVFPDVPVRVGEDAGAMTAAAASELVQRPVPRRARDPAAAGRPHAPPVRDGATLETIGAVWWSALDAADTAAHAASIALAASELAALSARLAAERACTVELLERIARDEGVRASFANVLISRSALRSALGLPSAVKACVFNLDGVVIASAALHSAAWAETLDAFVDARVERTGGYFPRFDPRTDYRRHFHGRTRLDGVRDFLASRGIALPEGEPGDAPGAETVNGLANRKKLAVLRRLDEEGVRALEGARRYLEAAREAGVGCVGISASANTEHIVEAAGLSGLIERCVDGNTILEHNLRPRPAPDMLFAACDLVGVDPAETAVFETSAAGVQAARASGCRLIVGVAAERESKPLLAAGADLVVGGLSEVLDRNLRALR
jgi:HAD superfamily hydrolase (TIGR01509 family)